MEVTIHEEYEKMSLARRAWIEIIYQCVQTMMDLMSLARRAWIEIF